MIQQSKTIKWRHWAAGKTRRESKFLPSAGNASRAPHRAAEPPRPLEATMEKLYTRNRMESGSFFTVLNVIQPFVAENNESRCPIF